MYTYCELRHSRVMKLIEKSTAPICRWTNKREFVGRGQSPPNNRFSDIFRNRIQNSFYFYSLSGTIAISRKALKNNFPGAGIINKRWVFSVPNSDQQTFNSFYPCIFPPSYAEGLHWETNICTTNVNEFNALQLEINFKKTIFGSDHLLFIELNSSNFRI